MGSSLTYAVIDVSNSPHGSASLTLEIRIYYEQELRLPNPPISIVREDLERLLRPTDDQLEGNPCGRGRLE